MTPPGLERLAINQVTTPAWSLVQAIEGYSRHGVHGIGVWRDKLAECGLAEARRALRAAGAWVPSLCKAGDLGSAQLRDPQAALDDTRRALDEAAEIGAATVVFVSGGIGSPRADLRTARARVVEHLQQAAPHARAVGVTLGIEPFHPMHAAERGCINTLAQAHRLCEEVGDGTAIVLDVFHTWWDPELDTYLDAAHLQRTASIQLCDWRVPTRHPVQDRAMVGDGAADVAGLVAEVERQGWRGPYEIEIFSNDWWARPPGDVVEACMRRWHELGASIAHSTP